MHNEKWQAGDDNVKKSRYVQMFQLSLHFIFFRVHVQAKVSSEIVRVYVKHFALEIYRTLLLARFISNLSTRIIYREKFHTFFLSEFYFSEPPSNEKSSILKGSSFSVSSSRYVRR